MTIFTWVMLIAAAVLVSVVLIAALRQRVPRSDDGVHSFQQHLNALSPEARRHSIDRGKDQRSAKDAGPTIDPRTTIDPRAKGDN